MVFGSAGTAGARNGGVMTEPDGLPLNHPDTVSAFGGTTTIRPKLFASVKIFPGEKSSASPIFSSPWSADGPPKIAAKEHSAA
jgi:hypothetical protein